MEAASRGIVAVLLRHFQRVPGFGCSSLNSHGRKMRRQDRADYTVFCGEWNIGRIYDVRGGPEHLRWFGALHFPSKPESLRTDNRAANLEEAKAEFQKSWDAWKAWASLEETAG